MQAHIKKIIREHNHVYATSEDEFDFGATSGIFTALVIALQYDITKDRSTKEIGRLIYLATGRVEIMNGHPF